MKKNSVILAYLFLLIGCSGNLSHRSDQIAECGAEALDEGAICGNAYHEKYSEFDLAFVEFTEIGNLFNPDRLDRLTEELEALARNEEGLAVIVFIHGWKHNANPRDENVQSFKQALNEIARSNVLLDRKLVGVYIGWRGESLNVPLIKNITYWDRKAVAEEVGRGGVTDVLVRLDNIDKLGNNYLIIVGHSFGGALALNALDDIIIERLIAARYGRALEPFGDGIVLLNPAIEATQGLIIKENSMKVGMAGAELAPIMYVLSSQGDSATRTPFRLGQILGVGLTWDQVNLKRLYGEQKFELSEAELDSTTIGNFSSFHTGEIKDFKEGCDVGALDEGAKKSLLTLPEACIGHWVHSSFCTAEGANFFNNYFPCRSAEPVDFIRTSESFITDHNDIFNVSVTAFLASAISRSIFIQSGGERKFDECMSGESFDFGKCFDFHSASLGRAGRGGAP